MYELQLQEEHNAPDAVPVAAAEESITVLLARVNDGDRRALDDLIPLVYNELHRMAAIFLRRESQHHTLQSTALIHEAYLRLADYGGAPYRNRGHFYAVAATVMRRILVDHARARHAAKRDTRSVVTLQPNTDVARERDRVVISLDDALTALAREDETKARLVEMRFFGGLTVQEISECMDIPDYTVRRALRSAQIWLRREMEA
jgi:RNA polymerase sigma factor (TIGR02999 family)